MTATLESPYRPSLTFQVVADDGQVVHARVDGRLAHRFQPAVMRSQELESVGEFATQSHGTAVDESIRWQAAEPSGDEPLAVAIGSDAYQRRVLLNLSAVTGMDTSGVHWLLTLQKRMDAVGGRLVLHSLSPAAKNVVSVLKLNGALKVAVDEFDAVQRV